MKRYCIFSVFIIIFTLIFLFAEDSYPNIHQKPLVGAEIVSTTTGTGANEQSYENPLVNNGTDWSWEYDISIPGMNNSLVCMAVHNGNIYAGGLFTEAGGIEVSRIAMWDGDTWNSVGVD